MDVTPLRVFVGRDALEPRAYDVCVQSMRATCSRSLQIEPLIAPMLTRAGLYRRQYATINRQRVDASDGQPFSTDFAFTRFLVPALCQWQGITLFCDSDFLWRKDVSNLFDEFDPRYAVQVVKHDYQPADEYKMRGQLQSCYPRKNWSSLMLFNCSHSANQGLTPAVVDAYSGRWLHGFGWLEDRHIGELSSGWNCLEGHDDHPDPMAMHYTRGTPDMPGFDGVRFADEWRAW